MLTTPTGSSPSTACGIISCAVTHTIQPAAALSSQRKRSTDPFAARAKASNAPNGSTSPEGRSRKKTPDCGAAVMGQRQADCCTFRDILQADAKAQRQCTADGIRLPGQCQCSGKARHHTLGRLCKVTAAPYVRRAGPACQQLPGKLFPPAKGHTAPSTSPTADGIHAGSGKVCPRWIAGSSRLHTLAASMMPAAMPPQDALRAGPRLPPQQKTTPAAPSVVHAAGNSSTHAVKTIWFTIHSPFARCMCAEAKRCRKPVTQNTV